MKRTPQNPKLVLQEAMRQDFGVFLRRAYAEIKGGEPLLWNWHLAAIVHHLDQIAAGEARRSLISMPPRSLKSIAISIVWVAWMLGKNPRLNFVCISYSNELSAKFGRDCLTIMQSHWYRELFPGTIISTKRSAAHDFTTTQGGGRLATSITGTLTGRGGDIIIIDDPIKPDEVWSEAPREAVNHWFKSTASSRLDNKATGSMLIVMQRLHEHDLAGTVLEAGGWQYLKLQAIADEDETIALPRGRLYHRRKGQALHEEREPLKTLETQRVMMGSTLFAAQFQQDPLPAFGNIILAPWLKTYSPSFDPCRSSGRIIQSWDCATKDNPQSDLSVCVTAHVYRREVRVLHVFRERLQFPDLKRHAIRLALEWQAKDMLIEDQASGAQLVQVLGRERPATMPMPIPILPTGDKMSRMLGVSGQIEAGQLLLPEEAHWLIDFKAELLGFPNVRHDDQCDALSQLMNWVQRSEALAFSSTLAGPVFYIRHDDGSVEQIGDDGGLDVSDEEFRAMGMDPDDPWGPRPWV